MLGAIGRFLARDCEVVGRVTDGGAVLAAASRAQPDVIVLDLYMPTLHGIDVCRQIMRVMPDVKIIFLSAEAEPAIVQEALAAGASAFISKLALCEELLPAITRLCGTDAVT